MTNYERIKNMSVEELAALLGKICGGTEDCVFCPAKDFCDSHYTDINKGCAEVLKRWLESEVTEE